MSLRCELTGLSRLVGNNVSHSNRKTKRDFKPNIQPTTLRSNTLGSDLKINVATSTLRTISNKYGGDIDSFLINYRSTKLTDFAKVFAKKIAKKLTKSGTIGDVEVKNKGRKVVS